MSASALPSPLLQPAPAANVGGIYLVLMLNGLVAAAGLTVIYLMLATLYREYSGSTGVGWAVTSYLLVSSICAALCGRLGDLLGRRFMCLVVLGFAAAGSLLSSVLPSLAGVIAGCALQGTAGALMPLSIGLARENLPTQRVPVALGILSCSAMFGSGVTYLIGGIVVDHYAAHGGFALKIGMAAVAFAAVVLIVPRPTEPQLSLNGVDMVRGILFAPALALALICLELRRSWGWGDARIIAGFAAAVLLMAYWVRHQATEAKPLIDVRMLAKPRIALPNLAMILMGLGAIQLAQILSLLLQQPAWTGIGFGMSPTAMGWVLLPLNALTVIASPMSGRVGQRIGMQRVAALGALACLGAWLLMLPWHASFLQVMTAAVICTIGYAVLTPSLYNLIAEASPVERASEAAGVSAVGFGAFMAVGSQMIFGLLAGSSVQDAAHGTASYPSEAAFISAFGYIAAMSLACLVVLLAMPARTPAGMRPLDAAQGNPA